MRGTRPTMRRMLCAASVALVAVSVNAAAAQDISSPGPIDIGPAPAPATAPAAQPGLVEGVVAVVNDEIITSYDLRQRMTLIIATSGVRVNQENLPQIQQQALRSLVDERLQMQELKRFEVNIPDAQVDAEIGELAASNNTTAEALFAQLAQAGIHPDTLRSQVRAQIGWRILVTERFRSRARIGEDQIDATLQRIQAASAKPQFLVGEVYLDAAQVGGMAEAMNGATQLIDQLVKGAPFQAVARQFSAAPSAVNGGDAGWLISGDMAPEVEAALQQMQPGQLSRPIQTKDGVYIVYLREKRTGGGATMVNLRQAAIRLAPDAPEAEVQAAASRLMQLQPTLTCDNILTQAEGSGVLASELGESDINQLAPEFRNAAMGLAEGQVSTPIRTQVGLHLLAVCGKRTVGADVPSREQVGNRLFGQQLTMLARRYLRDLRNSATIETR